VSPIRPKRQKAPAGAFWRSCLMHFHSGAPMHFHSGVDTYITQRHANLVYDTLYALDSGIM